MACERRTLPSQRQFNHGRSHRPVFRQVRLRWRPRSCGPAHLLCSTNRRDGVLRCAAWTIDRGRTAISPAPKLSRHRRVRLTLTGTMLTVPHCSLRLPGFRETAPPKTPTIVVASPLSQVRSLSNARGFPSAPLDVYPSKGHGRHWTPWGPTWLRQRATTDC